MKLIASITLNGQLHVDSRVRTFLLVFGLLLVDSRMLLAEASIRDIRHHLLPSQARVKAETLRHLGSSQNKQQTR